MRINFINSLNSIRYGFLTNNLSKPKLKTLNSDVFEKSQEPSFKGKPCATDGFRVKYLFDMPCPCCGQNMVTNSQLASFIENVSEKRGEELVEILERYKDYYRPVEKEAVEEIEKYSIIRPDANIAELTKEISILHREKLVNEQTLILDELKMMSNLINKSRREAYEQYLDNAQRSVRDFDDDKFFKRKTFIAMLDKICEGATTDENYEKIRNVALKMPNSLNSTSAFFIKYSRRGQEEIASRLLNGSLATVEHVVPKARGGDNITSNYVAMCAKCNSTRGDIPYGSWFNVHPEMPNNLQKYLDEVTKRIKNGDLKGYERYPYEIAETINMESGNKAKIKVNEFITADDTFEDIPKGATKEERIVTIQKKLDKKKEQLAELYKISEELSEDKEYQDIVKYFELMSEYELANKTTQILFKKYSAAKQAQEVQQRRIEKAKKIEEDLLDSNIQGRERKKLEESLAKTKERIKKHLNVDEEAEQLRVQYDAVLSASNRKKQEIDELKEKIKLPEHFAEKEKELSDRLAKIYSKREELASLRVKVAEKEIIQNKKTEVQSKIKQLQYTLSVEGNINDYGSNDDNALLQKYETLIKKKDYLDSLKATDVKVSKKLPRGLKSDFILKEARKSVNSQISELSTEPVVVSKNINDEIEELQSKKEIYNEKLAKIEDTERRIAELEELLHECDENNTEQKLISSLERVRKDKSANKERIETKMRYVNIDRQISALEELIKRYASEIKRISKEA